VAWRCLALFELTHKILEIEKACHHCALEMCAEPRDWACTEEDHCVPQMSVVCPWHRGPTGRGLARMGPCPKKLSDSCRLTALLEPEGTTAGMQSLRTTFALKLGFRSTRVTEPTAYVAKLADVLCRRLFGCKRQAIVEAIDYSRFCRIGEEQFMPSTR
jgi:hypothetical protein